MTAMRAVESKHHLWLDSNGEILETIRVYFGNEPPKEAIFRGEYLTASTVISLVNLYWKCDDVEDENGEQIGGHVPGFVLVEEQQYAHVLVKFHGMYVNMKVHDEICSTNGFVCTRRKI